MTEIRYKNSIVRIHGNVEREQLEEATVKFIKGVLKCQKQREIEREKQK